MSQKGFSLVELAVVLTIVSIVIAGGLSLTTARVQQVKLERTAEEMEKIDDAMAVFLYENTRLPCPAQLTVQRGDAAYGREATDCADASPPTGTYRVEHPAGSGTYVRIGGVPFYDLNLPDRYNADDWKGRYVYAVSEDLITSTEVDDTGIITVDDESGTISSEVAWLIFSPGATNAGAYGDKSGAAIAACNAAALDGENCDYSDGTFMDGLYNNGDVEANFFDDLILWETVSALFNVQLTVGTSLPTCSDGEIVVYSSGAWTCLSCASGEVLKADGSGEFACGTDN